jgi:hypothetical protein
VTVGTGAQGFVGVAIETVSGTYEAPTHFVPIQSESVQWVQETVWRRPIRASADIVGAVPGNGRIEGDLSMEAFEDVVALFLYCGRTNVAKTGTTPNFTYEFTGSAVAVPNETLSLTVVRNEVTFGYTGCVMGSFNFTVEDGLLQFSPTIIGRDEATQTLPVPTWTTGTQAQPYGAGMYNLQIPTPTQIFDADGFDFGVDDSAEAQYRLKDTSRGAQFVSFGERSVTLSLERDFDNRTEYDAFKALTSQAVKLTAVKGANNSISLEIPASIKDTYEMSMGGQGDLLRASISYNGVLDAAGNAYKITVKTQEDLTVP